LVFDIESLAAQLGELAGRASLELLALAIAIYTLSLIVSAVRWLTASKLSYSGRNVLGTMESLLVGIFANNILTFYNIVGEAVRVAWASFRLRVESTRLLAGALAERASELPVAFAYLALSATPIAKVTLVGLIAIPSLKSYAFNMWRAFKDLASSPQRLLAVLALSIAIWLMDTLRIVTVAYAFGINIEFTAALGLTVIHVASRFSPTPAGLGVLEGGFLGYLRLLGVPVSDAILIVLGERLVSTIIPSALGALIVFYRGGLGVLRSALRGAAFEGGYGY